MRELMFTAVLCLAIPATGWVRPACAQSLAHGKYLVERASMCHDCHTPRDDKGQLIMSQALRGAPIGSTPIHPMPWADAAPPIAGLPSHFTADQMVAFLETGKRPDGSMARPPMPQYRFSHDDAESVMLYVRSVTK